MESKATDVVIFVMGPGAAGKSTFIDNILRGDRSYKGPRPPTGDGYEEVTERITPYFTRLPSEFSSTAERLVLVDTPSKDDVEATLRMIRAWFTKTYEPSMDIAGVIYLYPISNCRITGSEQANLRAFARLCGKEALVRVCMATTRWDLCIDGQGEMRESILRTQYWHKMVEGGSMLRRLFEEQDSAAELLNVVLATARRLNKELPTRQHRAVTRKKALKDELKRLPKNDKTGRRKEIEDDLEDHRAAYAPQLKRSTFGRLFSFLR